MTVDFGGGYENLFTPVASSRIAGYRYIPEEQTLEILFLNNGAVYAYGYVTEEVYRNFIGYFSYGKFINEVLNLHPYYRRV